MRAAHFALLTALAAGGCDPGAGFSELQARLELSEDALFLEAVVGHATSEQIAVRSTGRALAEGSVRVEGPFTLVGEPRLSMQPGARRDLEIRFAPEEEGEFTGALIVDGPDDTVRVPVVGRARICEDRGPCQRLVVTDGACDYEALEGGCDDGSACTTGDTCQQGECRGFPVSCPDAGLCSRGVCDDRLGCIQVEDPAVCDDGNPCTSDRCSETFGCAHEPVPDLAPCGAVSCAAAELCILGSCTVTTPPDGFPCSDDRLCTTGDRCEQGECVGDTQPGAPVVERAPLFGGGDFGEAVVFEGGRVLFRDVDPSTFTLTEIRAGALEVLGRAEIPEASWADLELVRLGPTRALLTTRFRLYEIDFSAGALEVLPRDAPEELLSCPELRAGDTHFLCREGGLARVYRSDTLTRVATVPAPSVLETRPGGYVLYEDGALVSYDFPDTLRARAAVPAQPQRLAASPHGVAFVRDNVLTVTDLNLDDAVEVELGFTPTRRSLHLLSPTRVLMAVNFQLAELDLESATWVGLAEHLVYEGGGYRDGVLLARTVSGIAVLEQIPPTVDHAPSLWAPRTHPAHGSATRFVTDGFTLTALGLSSVHAFDLESLAISAGGLSTSTLFQLVHTTETPLPVFPSRNRSFYGGGQRHDLRDPAEPVFIGVVGYENSRGIEGTTIGGNGAQLFGLSADDETLLIARYDPRDLPPGQSVVLQPMWETEVPLEAPSGRYPRRHIVVSSDGSSALAYLSNDIDSHVVLVDAGGELLTYDRDEGGGLLHVAVHGERVLLNNGFEGGSFGLRLMTPEEGQLVTRDAVVGTDIRVEEILAFDGEVAVISHLIDGLVYFDVTGTSLTERGRVISAPNPRAAVSFADALYVAQGAGIERVSPPCPPPPP